MPGSWRVSFTDSPLSLLVFVHLHTRSWFSFRAGGSCPADLVQHAARLGQPALALTDRHGIYGTVRFQKACRVAGVHAVLGAEIIVDGAYRPDRVSVRVGERVRLRFLRRDPSPCVADVVFPELGIRRTLALNRATVVELPALSPGEYAFRCGMGMIRGAIVVLPR